MARSHRAQGPVTRRGFLKGAATVAAGTAALSNGSVTDAVAGQGSGGSAAPVPPLSAAQLERDAGNLRPPAAIRPGQRAVIRPGSDLMVQVLRDLGIEYVAGNPGSSFEGIQESIINYGMNDIEFITALHEESAVAAAHGYAKAEGRPMATLLLPDCGHAPHRVGDDPRTHHPT